MSEGWRGSGLWIVRAAILMQMVALIVRYFWDSSASDTAATWIFVLSLAVGLIGIGVAAVEKRRKAAPTTDDDDPEAA